MPFLRPIYGECSNNINIIKWLEYLQFDIKYHQVIKAHIVYLGSNLDLIIFIAEKALSTDVVDIGNIKAYSTSL